MNEFEVRPRTVKRRLIVDAGYLAHKRHIIHGLVEADISIARTLLHERSKQLGSKLSFTAFLAATYARAIAEKPRVQAYQNWRGQQIIFKDVDIATLIEPSEGAVAIPHVLRNANLKSVLELSDEIRAVQEKPGSSAQASGLTELAPHLPRFIRLMYFWVLKKNPHWYRSAAGTTVLTSIGMFGKSGGWGIAFLSTHTLGLTVGGIAKKPAIHDGKIEPGEFLQLTLSFDHDLVDGAPAARFSGRLIEMLETAVALQE
ncbi:MAG: 2-oxo acid dehydrogenase subunit E2 [Anaerolineales bacterium]|jgi:pyruvate/2-oxoglutarate dehydrogenase complex dihydrolipoamide acyltransferase (E2) component